MEMFGMIGGLAGAGASIAGGIMNAEAQDETNQLNWAINVMNMQERRREREEAIAMALKVRAEQKLGTTDIRGTRTHFIPGRGWVVEGAPDVLAMQQLQDAEQKKVLQHDLPQLRKQRDRNYARSLGEEAIADTYRRQLANVRTPSDEAIAADLYNAQAMGLREANQDAGRSAYRQMFRTADSSNAGEVAGAMSRENNAAYAKAALTSRLMSRGLGQAEADKQRNSLANLYNLFATRAGNMPTVNYKPQNLDNEGTLPAGQAGLLSAGQQATSMFGKKGGELDYTQANMGWGNAIAAGGSALASAFRGMGASKGGGVSGFGGSSDIYEGQPGDTFIPNEA